MVFRLPRETEMTLAILDDLLAKHKQLVVSRFGKLYDAYKSDHEILRQKDKEPWKPDNRIVVNFPKYIVDTMNGFFIGNPIKIVADDEAVSAEVEHIDQYNDQDDNNAELSKICSIFGKGYDMYYTDENSERCITYLTPIDAFMVFDDSVAERPLFFVRRYTDYEGNEYGSISDSRYTRNFQVKGGLKWLGKWTAHNFDGVPATEFVENDERQGIFEPIMSIVNAYNKAVSEAANNNDYFSDAYLKILGAAIEKEDIHFIRDNRIINLTGEDAEKITVEFMGKPSNDEGQEHLLDRLERLIFQISMVANISDENFGSATGVALKYKLQAMSNLAKTKERKFASGMNNRYKVLFSHPTSKVPKDAWMQLKYKFTPNIPANMLEEAQIAAQMEGITSHETQLKVLSIVDNVQDELDKIEEENKPDENDTILRRMFPTTKESTATENEDSENETA